MREYKASRGTPALENGSSLACVFMTDLRDECAALALATTPYMGRSSLRAFIPVFKEMRTLHTLLACETGAKSLNVHANGSATVDLMLPQ